MRNRLVTDAPRGLSLDERRPAPTLTPNFAPAAASRNARHDEARSVRNRPTHRSRSPWSTIRAEDIDRRERISRGAASSAERIEALRIARERNARERVAARHRHRHRHGELGDDDGDNAVGFPPLRRMGRRNIADGPLPASSLRESWSPASTVNGLGDRDRSLSPVADHWDHMLSSIAPDPLPPTAESSFTSAAASASFSNNSQPSSRTGSSNSNTASSSHTNLTIPSPTYSNFVRICEDTSDDSVSDTEVEDDLAPPHPSYPPYRSSAIVGSFYGEVTAEELERQVDNPLVDGPVEERVEERNTAGEMTLDQELRRARVVLERLSRRQDIPDEFWALVGLGRPLAERMERLQERERLS
jgi:hypothetical protein